MLYWVRTVQAGGGGVTVRGSVSFPSRITSVLGISCMNRVERFRPRTRQTFTKKVKIYSSIVTNNASQTLQTYRELKKKMKKSILKASFGLNIIQNLLQLFVLESTLQATGEGRKSEKAEPFNKQR